MIVKSKHVRASRVSQQQASSALNSHLKYLQYRERDPALETRADRDFFDDQRDHVERREAHDEMMGERAGDIYYHRLILSPAADEPVRDWHTWTREVMGDLEDHLDTDLTWYAVPHQNTDDPHVHVVLSGTGIDRETGREESVTLTPDDFRFLRESGHEHSDADHYHFVETTLHDLDERDTTTRTFPEQEPLHEQGHEQGLER